MNFLKKISSIFNATPSKKTRLIISENQIQYYEEDYRTFVTKGFRGNADVYKIVNDLATRVSEPPLMHVKIKSRAKAKEFFAKGKRPLVNTKDLLLIRKEAIGDEINDSAILKLLQKPNLYQTQDEFEEMCTIYWNIFGEICLRLERFGKQPISIHLHPPSDVAAISDGAFRGVKAYDIVSISLRVPAEDMLIIARSNLKEVDQYGPKRGMSPFIPGKMALQMANEADSTSVDTLQSGGARGAVFVDDPMVEAEEGGDNPHEANFMKKMYGKFQRGRLFFSNAKLGYVDLSRSAEEIGIQDLGKLATSKLCRLLNYPEILLTGDIKYENLRSASKLLIVSNVIPFQMRLAEALTNWLMPKFGLDGILIYDPLYFSEIQEDIKDTGPVLEGINFLTVNEKREYLNYPRYENELADKVMVGSGLMPIDDLNIDLQNQDYSATGNNNVQ